MHLARVLDDKAPNYLKQGLGWSYHAPCAGHDAIQLALGMTFRPGRRLPLPLLPRPDDLRGRRAHRRGDPPERHVEGDRRRLGRPAHVEPLRQARRSASRTSPPASPTTPSTPRASAGRSRPTGRTRSSSARSASPRPPRATSTRRSTAPRARSSRSSSSSRTTATASRSRRATRRRTPTPPTTSPGFLNLQDHPLRRPGRLRLLPRDARGGRVRPDRRGLRDRPRRPACGSTPTRTPTGTSSTATPEELAAARAAGPASPLPPHSSIENGPSLRGGDRARSRPRTSRPTRRRPTAPRPRPTRTPQSIHDFVVPEPWVPEATWPRGPARRLGRRR